MIHYYIRKGNSTKGPYLLDDLKYLNLNRNTYVRIGNDGEWKLLHEVDDLKFLLQIQDKYVDDCDEPTHPTDKRRKTSSKSMILVIVIAAILVFLGAIAMYFAKAEM